MGAVVAGEGLERVAEIAERHAGAPVAVVVPRVGVPARWARYERYVGSGLAGGRPARPEEVTAEVAVSSGGQDVGAVLLLGPGRTDAGEYLHVAAIAALTEVAVAEARDDTEQSLRGSFVEELLRRDDMPADEVVRRGRRLGCDLAEGGVALCAEAHEGTPGRIVAAIGSHRADALAQVIDGRVYALVPGSVEDARRLAARLGRRATVGISSRYSEPDGLRRALEEAELVLRVSATGAVPEGGAGEGTYRLLFHVLASRPEEIESFYQDTVAALVAYDEQYASDLIGTIESYLENNCNMNQTAASIHAHRHTVAYRLDRIRELSGLDPGRTEDRERLGLGLKAYRIMKPRLHR
ncbi:MAG TPA: helix-turn-helix domain-containing protein [Thermoleophilaceae bacterium]|nr:helix-turn-helix domain-containing protein [Thermoleophilaceae bacterium]